MKLNPYAFVIVLCALTVGCAKRGSSASSDPAPRAPSAPAAPRAVSTSSACDRPAPADQKHSLSFTSLNELREFTARVNFLGEQTANPLCTLLQIAREPSVPATREGSAVAALVGASRAACATDARACGLATIYDQYVRLTSNLKSAGKDSQLVIAPDWKRVDLAAVNLDQHITFSEQPDGAKQLRDLLLTEIALEHAMTSAAPWVRATAAGSANDDLAATAAAEFWAGYPAMAYRAYLRGLTCADESAPLALNTCGLRRDVAGLAMVEVYSRLRGRHERALKNKLVLNHPETRPIFHRLKLTEEVADLRERLAESIRKNASIDSVRDSRDGALMLEKLRLLLDIGGDDDARDVYRAVTEIQSFELLVREVDRFEAGNEKIAQAQLGFWQNSFELKEIAELTADRMDQIFARLQLYIDDKDEVYKLRTL